MKVTRIARRLRGRIAAGLERARRRTSAAGERGRALAEIARALFRAARHSLPRNRTSRPLRIGVDIRAFYEPLTGVGWYLHHLLEELAGRDDVELYLFGDAAVTSDGPHLHVELPMRSRYAIFDFRGMPVPPLARQLARAAFPLFAWLHRCDLFFGANYFLPRSLSAIARRRVVTVHDLTFRRFPELLQVETLANLNREMSREVFRADAVICVSESTRRDLIHYFDVDPSRAVVVHSGLAPMEAGSPPVELPPRFALFVSTIEPRKNLGALIRAFELVKDEGWYEGSLVVVGRVGWKSEETVRAMRSSRWAGEILHLDYITRSDLAAVYGRAEMFVFPSIYEGFGFPLLEAMSLGVPCVAARSSSLPEIGGDAALYFDPARPEELAELMRRVGSDPALRVILSERGRIQAERFRWSEAARQTLEVFRRVGSAT